VVSLVKTMPVLGTGIRDAGSVLNTSVTKVLKALESFEYRIRPKKMHYDCLEIDEFWTYVGKKKNKVWLIYAYRREGGEVVAYVLGKRETGTAKKLRADSDGHPGPFSGSL
jgi:hypothetical protein